MIGIKRKPKFSYDDPTRGTVWFDDFSIFAIKEISAQGSAGGEK
jgi:hypothetical protein